MTSGRHIARQALYERWVRDYGAELYRFAYRACGDREVAEDLVQETFYEAWKCMNRLRETERARAWLFQILRHRYSRWVRTEQRSPAAVPLDAAAGLLVARNSGESKLIDRDALQVALNRVNDVLKVPLLMVFIEGSTCQETANRMDLPLGTVLSRIHRAKRQLRAILRDEHAQIEPAADQESSHHYRIGGDS